MWWINNHKRYWEKTENCRFLCFKNVINMFFSDPLVLWFKQGGKGLTAQTPRAAQSYFLRGKYQMSPPFCFSLVTCLFLCFCYISWCVKFQTLCVRTRPPKCVFMHRCVCLCVHVFYNHINKCWSGYREVTLNLLMTFPLVSYYWYQDRHGFRLDKHKNVDILDW